MATNSGCVYDAVVVGRGMIGSASASHLARVLNAGSPHNGDGGGAGPAKVAVVGPGEPASWTHGDVSERTIFGAHYDEGHFGTACHG